MPDLILGTRNIHWRDAGAGPVILMLHPMLGHGGSFRAIAKDFPEYRVILPDLPGHGQTDFDPDDSPIQAQSVALAEALLRGIEGEIHLVGHSFGGTVATRLAASAPDRFASLTLIEPVWFGFLEDAGHPGYETERAANRTFIDAVMSGDEDRATTLFMARWGGPIPFEAMPRAMQDYVRARIGLIKASAIEVGMVPGPRFHLSEIARLPERMLLIEGADSPTAIHDIQDVLAQSFPQAQRLTIPGAGHMLPLTHAKEVSRALRALIGAAAP